MKTLLIKAIEITQGSFRLIASNGDEPTEDRRYNSRRAAYAACDAMYNNLTWQGHKVKSGYRIKIG